jgi:hypothetical protein
VGCGEADGEAGGVVAVRDVHELVTQPQPQPEAGARAGPGVEAVRGIGWEEADEGGRSGRVR